jgi:hypothetical protein
MFNTKRDIQELTNRVEVVERLITELHKGLVPNRAPQARPQSGLKKKRVGHHKERYLIMHLSNGRIDIEASLDQIGRTAHEVIKGQWPTGSAESRISHALRVGSGRGGMISREQWLSDNPEQLDLFR